MQCKCLSSLSTYHHPLPFSNFVTQICLLKWSIFSFFFLLLLCNSLNKRCLSFLKCCVYEVQMMYVPLVPFCCSTHRGIIVPLHSFLSLVKDFFCCMYIASSAYCLLQQKSALFSPNDAEFNKPSSICD